MYHVFIVDDDTSFRRSLAIQLELEGFQVSEAENANEALNLLDGLSEIPNLIMSDLRMPGMTGIEFIEQVQQKFNQISVLLMSAFMQPENALPFAFFKKPFKMQKLLEYIRRLQE